MIKMTPQRIMKGNIDDVGMYYIIRHGENNFVVVEIIETESSIEDVVFNDETKIYTLEELKAWAEPLIDNSALDGDNFDWFISDRNI